MQEVFAKLTDCRSKAYGSSCEESHADECRQGKPSELFCDRPETKQPAGRRFLLVHLIWLVKGLSENVPASAEPRSANFEYRSDSKDSDATARPVQEHFL